MTVEDKKKLAALKQARSEAASLLSSAPSLNTKKAYLESCREYARFRYQKDPEFRERHAKSIAEASLRKKAGSQKEEAKVPSDTALDRSTKLIATLKDKKNAAWRAFFAHPSSETKAAFLLANATYYKTRSKHDPEFRKARNKANLRSKEKKSGIGERFN